MSNQRRRGGDEPKRPRKTKKRRRWLWYTFLLFFGLFLGAAGFAASFVYKAYQTLPAFQEFDPSQTSVILDSTGKEVYKLAADENRTVIKDLDEVPKEVQLAFIATEDHRFYQHFGVDVYRMVGAVWESAKYFAGVEGTQLEGGSTITMQLARNAFLTLDQTMNRKVQEMLIAIQLERQYTKNEILLMYLNQVDFGYQSSGLEAAAQTYFSKTASELTVSEAAMLAGILKGPSAYNPFDNYEGAMKRRAIVLDLMVLHGYMDASKAAELKKQDVVLKPAQVTPTSVTFLGDWYVDHVIRILTDPNAAARFGTPVFEAKDLYSKGLKIHTALDLEYQRIAQEKMQTIMPEQTKAYGSSDVPEAAVVIMDHKKGLVKALVGGMEHKQMLGYNRATQAYRQPGSAIKPIVAYLPAIDSLGWGPATVIDDSPLMHNEKGDDVWPNNYEFTFKGLTPMRNGLEQSINTMAVRALQAVTPRKAIEYAHKFGLETILTAEQNRVTNDQNLALALGGLTTGVTPLDLTAAYGALGSLGLKTDPVVITKIENKFGEIIFEANPRKVPVVDRDSAWLMVDIMKGSILRGTAYYRSQGFKGWPAAGKTGTTEDWHDAWFVGFTPDIVTGVWTGYDNVEGRKTLPGRPGNRWTGAGPPTMIWTAIMNEIVKEKPADWERPSNIVWVEVCKTSGMLPSPLCPKEDIGGDWFRKGFEPKEVDNVWTMEQVVNQPDETGKERWLLWQEGCGIPEHKLFIKRPTTFAKHPKDPENKKYWPADWVKEVPTETCTPSPTTSPDVPPGDPGTGTGEWRPPVIITPPPILPPPPDGNGGN